jgi:hypothetical protein
VVKAVLDFRQSRTPAVLLKDGAMAGMGGILLVTLLFGWMRLYRKLRTLVEQYLKPQMSKMQSKSFQLIQAGLLCQNPQVTFF